jgi:hypothetical protein
MDLRGDALEDGRMEEEALAGGNMGGAVKVGATVRRPAGAWTPTIQRLLAHLRARGLDGVPRPLGTDERGRDNVSYLPGVVPQYPLPGWVWATDVLVDAVTYLARLHEASAGFDPTGAVWRLPVREPAEVVCHNDFAPYNMVFVEEKLTGVVDWDTASPGPRVWDLAYLAYRLVPLAHPANHDAPAGDDHERSARLALVCQTYGHGVTPRQVLPVVVERLYALADFSDARGLGAHAEMYRRDARWLSD